MDQSIPPTVQPGVSVPQLVADLAEVSDWHGLGLSLGLKTSVLSEIERNIQLGSGASKRRVCEVLDTWMKGKTGDPSCRDVVSALEKMGEHSIANEMRRKYSGSVPGDYHSYMPSYSSHGNLINKPNCVI